MGCQLSAVQISVGSALLASLEDIIASVQVALLELTMKSTLLSEQQFCKVGFPCRHSLNGLARPQPAAYLAQVAPTPPV